MTYDERRYAIHRIRMKRQLWLHLWTWAMMSVFFVFLWMQSGAEFFWPIFPILGWGVGLGVHVIHVLPVERSISEERIRAEIERMS